MSLISILQGISRTPEIDGMIFNGMINLTLKLRLAFHNLVRQANT